MTDLPILIGSAGWVASTGDKNFRKVNDTDLVMSFYDFETYMERNKQKYSRIMQVRERSTLIQTQTPWHAPHSHLQPIHSVQIGKYVLHCGQISTD
jgi:hypothetical protein